MTIYDSKTGETIYDGEAIRATTNLDIFTVIKQQHPDLSNDELVNYYHILMDSLVEKLETSPSLIGKYNYKSVYSEAFKKWQEFFDSQKK